MANERTEKPTPKRREDARKKGQVPRRADLPAAAAFIAALVTLRMTGASITDHAGRFFVRTFASAGSASELTFQSAGQLATDAVAALWALTFPVICAMMFAGVTANFAQGGLVLSASNLLPKADRFNPISNLKRVFGINGTVEFAKGILKITGLVIVCYEILGEAIRRAPALVGMPAQQTLTEAARLCYDAGLRAGTVLLALGALDYGWGWFQFEKSLRMTRQEIKDEFRQQEGDPMVKGARRRAQRALLQRRIAAEVPLADVIVTNPTHYAVALRYDREKEIAPVVVAKGIDWMANRIREIAKEHDVPLVENPPLARALYKSVEMGQVIPPEFFRAVAEVLAYVYRLKNEVIHAN